MAHRGRPKGTQAKIQDLLLLLRNVSDLTRSWKKRWPQLVLEDSERAALVDLRHLLTQEIIQSHEAPAENARTLRARLLESLEESRDQALATLNLSIQAEDAWPTRSLKAIVRDKIPPKSVPVEEPPPIKYGLFTELRGRLLWQCGEALAKKVPLIVCPCCGHQGRKPPHVFLRPPGENARTYCATCQQISRSMRSRRGWTKRRRKRK